MILMITISHFIEDQVHHPSWKVKFTWCFQYWCCWSIQTNWDSQEHFSCQAHTKLPFSLHINFPLLWFLNNHLHQNLEHQPFQILLLNFVLNIWLLGQILLLNAFKLDLSRVRYVLQSFPPLKVEILGC